ncbi:MAG: hypothetical protein LH632_19985 [Rhodoferax sp.]|nr:hypothetical protein [Rhodoferax sp.]
MTTISHFSNSQSGPAAGSSRALSSMLLAAIVTSLIVAADSVVDSHKDGHLLLGWVALWAVGFAALALFGGVSRRWAAAISKQFDAWKRYQSQQHSDAMFLASAQRDPRVMAELQAAVCRAESDVLTKDLQHGRAWLDHRPLRTLSASYPGPRAMYRVAPLTGLPTQLQYMPC